MIKDESVERQICVMKISMTPAFVAVFAFIFYLLYLETIGVEVSTWFFFNSLLLVNLVGIIASLALNEALLRILYSQKFNLKRLAFRCMLPTIFCSLLWAASVFMSLIIPFVETFFQLFYGTLLATAIFVLVILRFRHVFNRLDKG